MVAARTSSMGVIALNLTHAPRVVGAMRTLAENESGGAIWKSPLTVKVGAFSLPGAHRSCRNWSCSALRTRGRTTARGSALRTRGRTTALASSHAGQERLRGRLLLLRRGARPARSRQPDDPRRSAAHGGQLRQTARAVAEGLKPSARQRQITRGLYRRLYCARRLALGLPRPASQLD